MRILIIEDEIIIARFIEQQVTANFDCSICIAINPEEVRERMPDFLPHLILCDINLKQESDGISLIEDIRKEYAFHIIFITSYQSKPIIERALTHDPLNYIIKPVDEAAIYTAIRIAWPIVTNDQRIGKKVALTSLEMLLSETELKVIQLIKQNKTSKEIAEILFVSPYTVKNHRHSICRKLGLKNENNALLLWVMHNRGV